MSVISGIVGAVLGQQSADKATEANQRNASETNATNMGIATATNATNRAIAAETNKMNMNLNLAARGAPLQAGPGVSKDMVGSQSAILPYYMGGAEQAAGKQAGNVYQAMQGIYGSPEQQTADLQAIMAKYAPGAAQSDQLAADISSGAVTGQMLAENQPVADTRMATAVSKKNAGLEALQQTLNDIDAIQAKRGYSGDSFGGNLLKFNARRQISTQGAQDIGDANLQSAVEKRATQAEGRNLQLNNMNLADQRAQSAIQRKNLPATTLASNYNNSLQPFSFFNMGAHNFNPAVTGASAVTGPGAQMPPLVPAGSSPWQSALQGVGAAGNTVANYLLNKNVQNNIAGSTPAFSGFSGNVSSYSIPPEAAAASGDYAGELMAGG